MPITVANFSTWTQKECGKWIAFGSLAGQNPDESNDRIEVTDYDNSYTGHTETQFHMGMTRCKYYWRFNCSPLVCGNQYCKERNHGFVMVNFRPPGWKMTGPGWQQNPFEINYNGSMKEQTFFVVNEQNYLVWNSDVWGPGPPAGWVR